MTLIQSNTQSDSHADPLLAEVEMALVKGLNGMAGVEGGRPVPAPPGSPTGGAGAALWGPTNQRTPHPRSTLSAASKDITSPLQMLGQVADHARKLNEEMLGLVQAFTGEAPPARRLKADPVPGSGFLPALASYAHEIETVHAEIAVLIRHLRGQL